MGEYSTFQIKKIERVLNKGIHQKFLNRKNEIKTEILLDAEESGTSEKILKLDDNDIVNEQLLWHGSPAVGSIVKRGFDERHSCTSGMFGAGIYFAENSSKSNQYVYGINGGTGCYKHRDKSCYICDRKILLCTVILGKSYQQYSSLKVAHAPPGHHSLSGLPSEDGLKYAEHVIYRGEQAYPTYLISYRIVK